MSGITKEQVEHVADLARLNLSDEEAEKYTIQLNDILTFFEKLKDVDTTNVEPTSHVMPIYNVMREDENRPSVKREEALKNAPDHDEGHFKVPAVMEE
ncbi:asparaginyl/glutamyl-tRNA amidotransferase subunit C [Ammoniphilus oxalaticus]|uniref:Aspartyl/glutamyl-tRNA(Asn/Gln) amidotransferase subunit C n=1 Tax=Ammoniphilus oxalaticus TaxID=66863 RepID=A0A419SDV5_9BACL|nr:Asp-tRNA(Asn)/Glu-tRNA(Gln) amidotransferase subunit GatC [Ammoniphilus oxalaticus]RKD21073.1 asparaginyl/glutamyl-tRNA amidotransferase subunit C [Ammoniphilus oxalaticus]